MGNVAAVVSGPGRQRLIEPREGDRPGTGFSHVREPASHDQVRMRGVAAGTGEREIAGVSFVQFQLLVRLRDAGGTQTMTQMADGVVYSRSGITYQAGLLEKAGLITRDPDPDDDRATAVTLTDAGRALLDQVLPPYVELARRLLFDSLTGDDLPQLAEIMARVRDHMRAQPSRSATTVRRRRDDAGA